MNGGRAVLRNGMLSSLLGCGVLLISGGVSSAKHAVAAENGMRDPITLFHFNSDDEPRWDAEDDRVMGGVSRSRPTVEDGVLIFAGEMSLENDGGFASIRTRCPQRDLSGYDALLLRVRGDGQRYRVSAEADARIRAGGYYAWFESSTEWSEVRVPFDSFVARSFGREIDAPRLNTSDVRRLGLMLSDKQAGRFRLEVDWIKAVETPEQD